MMDQLEEFNYINGLFDQYGLLLTEAQQRIMEYYYNYNLSISEISEELHISRNAVLDAIKKSTAKLENYEDKLHFQAHNKALREAFSTYQKNPNLENLTQLERMIKDGI